MLKNRKKLKVSLVTVHILSLIAIIVGIFAIIAANLIINIDENFSSVIVTLIFVLSTWNIILGIIEFLDFIISILTTKKCLRRKLSEIYKDTYDSKTDTFQSFVSMIGITCIIFLLIIIEIIL